MKTISTLCLVLCSLQLHAEELNAEKLLDQVISHPGSYSQVCDVASTSPGIPYRLFQITDFAGASFSKANQALVDKNRNGLIKAIRSRLLAVDFSKSPVTPSEDPKPEANDDGDAFGCDPKALSPMILTLIQQLHGIETLPELLAVEQKLVKGIAKAKDDTNVMPPNVAGWSVSEEHEDYDLDEPEAKRDRRTNLFHACVAQRDLIMTMAVLMREKAYEPYLATTLEAAYVKGIKADAAENGYSKLNVRPGTEKHLDGKILCVDPVTKITYMMNFSVKLPYTRESRDQIRAVAGKWINEHP